MIFWWKDPFLMLIPLARALFMHSRGHKVKNIKIFMWIFSCISRMCVRYRLNIRLHMNPLCGIMIYAEFMNFLCLSTSIMRLLSDFYSQYEEYVQSSSIQTLCFASNLCQSSNPPINTNDDDKRWWWWDRLCYNVL